LPDAMPPVKPTNFTQQSSQNQRLVSSNALTEKSNGVAHNGSCTNLHDKLLSVLPSGKGPIPRKERRV
jgi:hypothetical protein